MSGLFVMWEWEQVLALCDDEDEEAVFDWNPEGHGVGFELAGPRDIASASDDDHSLAGYDNEHDNLVLNQADSEMWLVKVSKFLAVKWEAVSTDNTELGTRGNFHSTISLKLQREIQMGGGNVDARLWFPSHCQPWAAEMPQKYIMQLRLSQRNPAYVFIEDTNAGRPQAIKQEKRDRASKQDLIKLLFTAFEQDHRWTFKRLLDWTKQPVRWDVRVKARVQA
ncbi:hypothetical protein HDU90_003061 [Geranomyces variabilis]|nr:hypothetical protein HDU90_003061 [Geranomyces variabilis]